MSSCTMRRRSSISWPFESFIIQKTKLAPLSCPLASDWEEVCESRGHGGEGFEAGTGVWRPGSCLGLWPFSSISACGMKAPTLSSFDCLAENGYICGCLLSFFFFFNFNLIHILGVSSDYGGVVLICFCSL